VEIGLPLVGLQQDAGPRPLSIAGPKFHQYVHFSTSARFLTVNSPGRFWPGCRWSGR
jgi:hypothetical protein